MIDMFKGLAGLEKGMAASWKRNSVILNNVANVDTPDFKASELAFESLYRSALKDEDGLDLKQTRASHMDIGNTDLNSLEGVVLHTNTTERMDGNNVDIDHEMTDFSKNYIWYTTLQRKVNGQFTQLRTAIKG